MRAHRGVALAVVAAATVAVGPAAAASQEMAPPRAADPVVVASQLNVPWAIAFLPDGSALFTERNTAKIRSIRDGQVADVQTVPDVAASGEGGLLGIAVSPKYAEDKSVFVYYTAQSDNRIAKLVLGEQPQPILTGIPKASIHNGGRIEFGPDGYLYAGAGDAGSTGNAQNPDSLGGKILRMTTDGKPAPDNPTPGSLVYSLGHRNVQGLTWDDSGRMYASEFGQNTWDELNLINPGGNYGWPECEGTCSDDRFVNPLRTWSTAEASPSGLGFYQGHLYMAGLRGQRLWQIPVNGDGTVGEPRGLWHETYGRLRAVAAAPGDALWVGTSNRDGRGDPAPDDDRILSVTGTP
ncbi:glucose/arabinose dehydrogenase [Herbihabitans rhizosphaerae]|uniref:Glucose/arabinose dehydrogenase n=1 Tax=Herbihabitans rhizosphaerae TaxID=1872711 RepID=A0A4Q7KG04_9PSEU|nr:PQQ-dependent sugar dehydrogenase [Herbihabitans rhizosphaerae]RZS33999.1 glucose/arabinose dehydrogenase [Herbihabitans rhizosphaerae]